VKIQFSIKIKKLNTDNGGEYVIKVMSSFLQTKGIIHDLSPPYVYESNSPPEHVTCTIVTIVQLFTFDCPNMIPQELWAKVYSTAIHIKNHLLYSTLKLKKLQYKIMFGDKLSIQHIYPFGAKYYTHVPEEK
jgi:hypothetical protein